MDRGNDEPIGPGLTYPCDRTREPAVRVLAVALPDWSCYSAAAFLSASRSISACTAALAWPMNSPWWSRA